jgi:hypothetical protein
MRSKDVVKLFNAVPVGARVDIVDAPVSRTLREMAVARRAGAEAS